MSMSRSQNGYSGLKALVARKRMLRWWWLVIMCAAWAAPGAPAQESSCEGWDNVTGFRGSFTLSESGSGTAGLVQFSNIEYHASGSGLLLNLIDGGGCTGDLIFGNQTANSAGTVSESFQAVTTVAGNPSCQYLDTASASVAGNAGLGIDIRLSPGQPGTYAISAGVLPTGKGTHTITPAACNQNFGGTFPYTPDYVPVGSKFVFSLPTSPNSSITGTWNFDGPSIIGEFPTHNTLTFTLTPILRGCDPPTGETTAFDGWYQFTFGLWKQSLSGGDFHGLTVQETNAAQGLDFCWFDGSLIPMVTGVSGGSWTVNADNTWGDDAVGWGERAVEYYRVTRSAPCHFEVFQQMQLICPDGSALNYGPVNQLYGIIDNYSVASERAGHAAARRF